MTDETRHIRRGSTVTSAVAGGDRRNLRIAEIAGRQRGLITPAQLRGCGLETREIERRLADGRLYRVFHGVYSLTPGELEPLPIALAAVLATAGRLAAMSCLAAWGVVDDWPEKPEVTRASGSRRKDILVHQTRFLPTHHTSKRHGIPCTTVARALLDVAETRPVESLVREAEYLKLTSVPQLEKVARECHGRRGARHILQVIEAGPAPTHEELERRMRKLIREAHLPRPIYNEKVLGYEVDIHWPQQRVIVEMDGWAGHSGRIAFEQDRQKDAALTRAGYTVLRITWRRLRDEPLAVVADISFLLAR